ncbi:MAG: hypothetical protein ACRDE8_18440 [Ginsengibacter sp.]
MRLQILNYSEIHFIIIIRISVYNGRILLFYQKVTTISINHSAKLTRREPLDRFTYRYKKDRL